MKITVIGAGNMGGAMIKGWAKKGGHELTITARTEKTLARFKEEFPGIKTSLDNAEAVKGADIIVLAVKPWLIEEVTSQIRDMIDFDKQVILSVAANVLTDKLRENLCHPCAHVLYVMPNIAAEYNESMTFLAPADNVPEEIVETVRQHYLYSGLPEGNSRFRIR